MADIGEALREARMRNRIDMAQVESATKIRAKYLRALENEEWELLPGPTFVKTFLRTYAEYLGLDARSLVEEYKQRYERPSQIELAPFKPVASRGGIRYRRRRPVGPWVILVLVLLAVLAGLWLLGRDDIASGPATDEGAGTPAPAPGDTGAGGDPVPLRITATSPVRVCLIDARDRQLLDRRLPRGRRTREFRSRRYLVGFQRGAARMRVGDSTYNVNARTQRVGYEITSSDVRRFTGPEVPRCP